MSAVAFAPPCLLHARPQVCKAPKATDETLANQLHENHARSKILCRPKAGNSGKGGKKGLTDKEAFILKHFAGDVTYSVFGQRNQSHRLPRLILAFAAVQLMLPLPKPIRYSAGSTKIWTSSLKTTRSI